MPTRTIPEPPRPVTRPAWRRALRQPLVWAAVGAVVAVPCFIAGIGVELVPFLVTLATGWLVGVSITRAARRVRPVGRSLAVQAVVAVVPSLALIAVVASGGDLLSGTPAPFGDLLAFCWLAAVPALAWTWLDLIGRVGATIGPRASRPSRAAASLADWDHDGGRWTLRFRAVPARMRTLVWAIVGTVVPLGILTAVVLVVLDPLVLALGARFAIVFVGVLLALPACGVLYRSFRSRTVDCMLEVDGRELRVDAGERSVIVALASIQRLRWRTDSEYARVVVATRDGVQLSLLAGMASSAPDAPVGLAPLPGPVIAAVRAAGLSAAVSRTRPGTITLTREG
ncbi:hypothetical protein [Leifsonia aquatica]|uniref:Uncharacterized protein n=1 Tax=Leifsonia aquatica TaxID=144185 RepID=A0A7W4UZ33_LEIAQ|nr:hypothetical protein [Leifsonia aquatica]MBB2968955.1 hypothetical protein [Leifsonia aquatica]